MVTEEANRPVDEREPSAQTPTGTPVGRAVSAFFGLLVVVVLGPPYLVLTLVLNAGRLVVHLTDEVLQRTRLRARIVGTATVQRRLEGDILAMRGDVRRISRELFELRLDESRLLTERDIEHIDSVIGYRESEPPEPFRFHLPMRAFVERLLTDEETRTAPIIESTYQLFAKPTTDDDGDDDIPPDTMWARTAMELLNQAEANLRRNTEMAFRAYLRAERYHVLGEYLFYLRETAQGPAKRLTDPIQSHARLVLDTVSGYDEGHARPVRELLVAPDADPETTQPKDDLSLIELDKALSLVNAYRLQDYRRFETLRVTILSFVAIASLLVAGALLSFPSVEGGAGAIGLPPRDQFQLVLAFGALGAAISGVRNVEHNSDSLQALEQILGYWLSVVRMFVGALSAFIVAIFLYSGLVAPDVLTLPLVLGVSLAAGFSERLLLRAISSFESQTGGGPVGPVETGATADRGS